MAHWITYEWLCTNCGTWYQHTHTDCKKPAGSTTSLLIDLEPSKFLGVDVGNLEHQVKCEVCNKNWKVKKWQTDYCPKCMNKQETTYMDFIFGYAADNPKEYVTVRVGNKVLYVMYVGDSPHPSDSIYHTKKGVMYVGGVR